MEKLSNASQFLDLGGLDSLRSRAHKDEKAALKEVAQQFEGIFVQMLMKSMREANAVFESDSPMNSQYTKFYEQMRDQQMSVELSDKGILGIADIMVQQLSPDTSSITPASVLQGNTAVSERMGVSQQAHNEMANSMIGPSSSGLSSINTQKTASSMQIDLASVVSGKTLPTIAANSAAANSVADKANFSSPDDFVTKLYPYAKKAADALGTQPEVLIAQSALETGWGQKMVKNTQGQQSNNLFNIKADKRWQGEKTQVSTLEYEQGSPVKRNADFRVYDSLEQSFNDFVSFISNGERYQAAKEVAAKPAEFIKALQDAGYATDPQYANKVINVMKNITQEVQKLAKGSEL